MNDRRENEDRTRKRINEGVWRKKDRRRENKEEVNEKKLERRRKRKNKDV